MRASSYHYCQSPRWVLTFLCFGSLAQFSSCWILAPLTTPSPASRSVLLFGQNENERSPSATVLDEPSASDIFEEFLELLQQKQDEIIKTLERVDGSGKTFCNDTWGIFSDDTADLATSSGGKTRVLQGGNVIEKGACSFTLIQQGVLTGDRAAAIRSRQQSDDSVQVQAGDMYSAGALSIVLHSKSPMVPTFRSDVRIFLVQSSSDDKKDDRSSPSAVAWFGGGADLTPYYLIEEDIVEFHKRYHDLCKKHQAALEPLQLSYSLMKQACDDYFYLPARSEHRGTGGIFFDDMEATKETLAFVEGVVDTWMPSWLSIVQRRRNTRYNEKQRQWQL
jgi:coproporphyrinogen III oxidase